MSSYVSDDKFNNYIYVLYNFYAHLVSEEELNKIEYNIKKHFTGSYKKQYWNKKEYKNI